MLIDGLLLFNCLFEFYLLRDDDFNEKMQCLSANYMEGKFIYDDKSDMLMLRSFKESK